MVGALLALQVLAAMPDAPHLRHLADSAGVPQLAALAVAYTETRNNLRPSVRGAALEWGRFQIKSATARARCPGLNVRTYDGNVSCFFKMFAEDVHAYGVERAICRHNTGRTAAPCAFADGVLALWKREELWEAASVAKDGTAVQTTTPPRTSPSPQRRAP